MKVADLMEKDFLCLDADDTLRVAAKKMADKRQDEAPVVRQGKFIGILSTSDIAAALVRRSVMGAVSQADTGRVQHELAYKHISHRPIWLDEDADLLSAFAFLVHKNDDCIPVLDKKKKLVGVVFTADLQKEMAKILSADGVVPLSKPKARGKETAREGGKMADAEPDAAAPPANDGRSGTELDKILAYVEKKGAATSEDVARAFRLPVVEIEGYAASMEKHGLMRLDYDLFGKMKLVSMAGQEKKKE